MLEERFILKFSNCFFCLFFFSRKKKLNNSVRSCSYSQRKNYYSSDLITVQSAETLTVSAVPEKVLQESLYTVDLHFFLLEP